MSFCFTAAGAGAGLPLSGRCNTAATGCDTGTLNSTSAANWPDVPYDLNCASGASCSNQAPTFWTEYELTGIQTQALVGTTETNVDSWAFTYAFPATGDSTKPALWLSSITRTGQDTSAGGSSSALTLPSVVFTGTPLANRVNINDGYPPITRQRLTNGPRRRRTESPASSTTPSSSSRSTFRTRPPSTGRWPTVK